MEDRGLGLAGTAKGNHGEWEGKGRTQCENATGGKVEMGEETQRATSRVEGTLGQSTTEVE